MLFAIGGDRAADVGAAAHDGRDAERFGAAVADHGPGTGDDLQGIEAGDDHAAGGAAGKHILRAAERHGAAAGSTTDQGLRAVAADVGADGNATRRHRLGAEGVDSVVDRRAGRQRFWVPWTVVPLAMPPMRTVSRPPNSTVPPTSVPPL